MYFTTFEIKKLHILAKFEINYRLHQIVLKVFMKKDDANKTQL